MCAQQRSRRDFICHSSSLLRICVARSIFYLVRRVCGLRSGMLWVACERVAAYPVRQNYMVRRKPLWYYSISHPPSELKHRGVSVYSTIAPLAAAILFNIAPIVSIALGGALKKLERHDLVRLPNSWKMARITSSVGKLSFLQNSTKNAAARGKFLDEQVGMRR